LGPPGIGFLYLGTSREVACWREGGTGGDSLAELQPKELPLRFEAGTLNTVGIAGLGAGLDYIGEVGITNIRELELLLTNQLMLGLRALPQVSMYGCVRLEQRVGTVAFALAGYRADEVAAILDQSFDIAVRAGLHCAPLVHERLGTAVDGLVRVSVGPFNTSTEVDIFLEAIAALVA
jgi:selenocysteine lyase/cysteine desulfurase